MHVIVVVAALAALAAGWLAQFDLERGRNLDSGRIFGLG